MNIINYFKESFSELKNQVSWISMSEAQKSTIVVTIFTVIFSLAIFLVDKVFQTGLEQYFKLFN